MSVLQCKQLPVKSTTRSKCSTCDSHGYISDPFDPHGPLVNCPDCVRPIWNHGYYAGFADGFACASGLAMQDRDLYADLAVGD